MRLFFLSIFIFLTGCASTPRPDLTREEFLTITSREYAGVSKDQVIGAAERLFRLADGDDFEIVHAHEGIHATRKWSAYLVIAAVIGTDYWNFLVSETASGVKARVQLNTQSQGVTPMATTASDWTATTMPMDGVPITGTAIYDVFWARMDYLLGKRPDWMTCEIADTRVKTGATWGSNEALCNSFNMKDAAPGGVAQK